ncbi:acetamidase/formamidase family protein [Deinococcus aquiradiocola]|uniref:Acetamidase n=1 Tax=Deinococcus aquiradiocola TaxID=393059 RepID=A0A917PB42_9DEIO|nr:acetamidase/formamidase family protein [Deinococcus aquiradiocola]GGJ69132.1 acetamidase [Deinococcus aquiradiocola]
MSGPHIHTIHHRHFGWDNSLTPQRHVAPGDTLAFDIQDASGGQLTAHSTAADVATFDFSRTNPVNGPVYVDGAEPGDALVIEVLDFQESDWGWTGIIPGFGLLAQEFKDPWLHISRYDRAAVQFTPDITLPTRPFTGTIGVAPAEPGLHSVVPPRRVGGNLDIRDLTRGAKLYLPVEVPGALFSVGDTHVCQGDGEVCGTAVETAMTAQLRFSVQKGANFSGPRFEVPAAAMPAVDARGYYATTGHGPDLYAASQDAIRAMIDHLGREYRLDPQLAYALCSVAVDLKISEIVDAPNWLVSAYLPRGIFR